MIATALPVAAQLAPVAELRVSTESPSEVPGDDEAPEWPDEAVESAMRAEQRERDADLPATPRVRIEKPSEPEEDAAAPLPKLDALIEQIPGDVRETLEELFRARFTSVQRVSKTALK